MLQEIEDEELLFQTSEEKKRARMAEAAEAAGAAGKKTAEEAKVRVESLGGAKFY